MVSLKIQDIAENIQEKLEKPVAVSRYCKLFS
jgi:hypothetical protein